MPNQELSEHLSLIAQLTDIAKGGHFRVVAFQNAATTVRDHPEPITAANVGTLKGMGKSCIEVVKDYLDTGTSRRLKELGEKLPGALDAMTMTAVKGIGPKTAMSLMEVGLKNLDDLVKAVEKGALDQHPGLVRFKDAILIARDRKSGRLDYSIAHSIGVKVLEQVKALPGVLDAEMCGSLRRKRPTIKDCDIVVKANLESHPSIHTEFAKLGSTFVSGEVKTTIYVTMYNTTLQCDLWTVEPWWYGGALAYATGSKAHNIKLRALARSRGMRIDEKGIFKFLESGLENETGFDGREDGLYLKGRKVADRLGGASETDLYTVLGVPYVEPTEREE